MSQVTAQIDVATLKGIDALASASKTTREQVAGDLLSAAIAEHQKKAAKSSPAAKPKGGDSQ